MVTRGEATEVLRGIAQGETTISGVGRSWREIYAGEVDFITSDGWRLVIFNDCDSLDYVQAITSPDGRSGEFDDWWKGTEDDLLCPSDALGPEEFSILQDAFRNAPTANHTNHQD